MSLASKVASHQTASVSIAPHLIVKARAGTGKTTTLIEGLKIVRGGTPTIQPSPQQAAVWESMKLSADAKTVCFVAFNKSIATELQRRVPAGCDAMTMHSFGLKAVTKAFGRVQINKYRTSDIISEVTGRDIRELRRTKAEVLKATEALVGLCKMNLVDGGEEELDRLAAHYDVDLNGSRSEVFALVPKVIERAKDVKKDNAIDFNDMIWLPVALGLSVFRYDLLLVDECVPGWTPVMLADGRSTTIKEIVESEDEFRVRAYDTARGIAMNCRVIGKQKILNQKPLVKVKVRHLHKTAGNLKSNFVVCTVDHKVWTINRGWVPAGDIKVGDDVIIETAAKTTQKGKITSKGRETLATLQAGNKRGLGNKGGDPEVFNQNKGGNGRGPSLAEQTLLDFLGEGWEYNYLVKTGDAPQFGRGDKPSHYKIDLANSERMIAVEVDGASHSQAAAVDEKKQRFLESQGWTVFRVSNRRAIQETAEVACEITGNCPRPARVVSVEPITIPDNYVYDVTVEGCHNFYANGILVHNCQDLNRCQQQLALSAGRRLILCGDEKQAIYGFAGADSESMPRMAETLGATTAGCVTLPLTVTRRCGKAIVEEARKLVPDFEGFETNGVGLISRATYAAKAGAPSYADTVQDADMILCRVNAPLVSQCFRFLKAGRRATIQGRDVAAGLVSTVKKLKAQDVPDLLARLSDWLHIETRKENAKRNPSESRLIALQDRYDCLVCFTDGANVVEDVIKKIESVFTDEKSGVGILLSSVHRAKGLEARHVFILQPKGATMPHPMARGDWQRKQENHILYVAITRAIEELTYVSE